MYRVFNHWVSGRKTLLFVAESAAIAAACATGSVMLAHALASDTVSRAHRGAVSGTVLTLLSVGFVGLYQAALYFLDLYDLRVAAEDRSRGARLVRAMGLAAFAMAMLLTVLRVQAPEGVVLGGAFGAIVGVLVARGVLGSALARPSRVLVVGHGRRAQRMLELLEEAEEATELAALVDPYRLDPGRERLLDVARRARAEAVILATEPGQERATTEELARCRYSGVRVFGAAQYSERILRRIPVHVLDGVQFATADELTQGPLRRASKRSFDIVVASVLLVLAAPLMAMLAVLIRLDSKGPAFYRQNRVGRNGKEYALWKFRSMRVDAEKNGAVWARANDDRVTRVGRFIRRTRMDEIPQVFNVLRGDMSFVGPRPERRVFIDIISRDVPYYALREGVKPGITGWAQIRYPYGASVEDGRNKLEFDLYYVKNGTLFLNLAIIFHTVRHVLLGSGGAMTLPEPVLLDLEEARQVAPPRLVAPARPLRVVALGGGTGMPVVLRGLARHVRPRTKRGGVELTAVVTMSDDGGSSGRLRRSRGLLPPGDVRNCLVALSASRGALAEVLQHRFGGRGSLAGHALGNLLLAALAEIHGDFLQAIRSASRLLEARGTVLPCTLDPVQLVAELEDGRRVVGERHLARATSRVHRVFLHPVRPAPAEGVLEAIAAADLVTLGPGSLYSSLLPNLLVNGVAEALRTTRARRVLVANLMTEPGETGGMSAVDHLRAVLEHAGPVVDVVLLNSAPLGSLRLERYARQGAEPVRTDLERIRAYGVVPIEADLLRPGPRLRHDARKLGEALLSVVSGQG